MTKGVKNDTQARVEESGASRKKRGRKKGSYIKPPHGLHTPRCIAVASGIPEHTVRYYLKKLAMEPVIENGRAYYTDTQSRKLIATAQEKKQKVAAAHADPGLSKKGFGVIPSNLKQMSLYQIAALMGKSRTTVWRWARSLPNQLELLSKNQRSVQGETTSFHGEQTVHDILQKLKTALTEKTPALFTFEESIMIIRSGGNGTLADVLTANVQDGKFVGIPATSASQEILESRVAGLEAKMEQFEVKMDGLPVQIAKAFSTVIPDMSTSIAEALKDVLAPEKKPLQLTENPALIHDAAFTQRMRLTEIVNRIVEHNRGWRDTFLDYPEAWRTIWSRLAKVKQFNWNDTLEHGEKQIDAAERLSYLEPAILIALQYEEDLTNERMQIQGTYKKTGDVQAHA